MKGRDPSAMRRDHDPFLYSTRPLGGIGLPVGLVISASGFGLFRWTTYLCPHCNGAFRRDYWPHNVRLGSGERICSNCGKVFDDDAREWPELIWLKKLRYLLPPGIIATGVSFLLVGIGALVIAPRDVVNWQVAVIIVGLSISPTVVWCMLRAILIRQSIHRYENEPASMRRPREASGH
jgi:hypothetical protein